MTALSRLAADNPSTNIALINAGRHWTYGEIRTDADRLARAMRSDRLSGERVALMLSNSPEMVIAYLACFTAGAVAVPLNQRYAPPEVEQALLRARPRWLIVHADRLTTLDSVDSEVVAGVRVIVVGASAESSGETWSSVVEGDETATETGVTDVTPETPAVMFFTSGSTGQPKGVVHSHASAHAVLASTSQAFDNVRPDDITQVFEPQVHISGFIGTFSTLLGGGTVVLYDGFDAKAYSRALVTHRPTLICTHIDILAQLLRLPGVSRDWFTSLRGVYTGGDTVPEPVQREFLELTGKPIAVGYGMTEAIWLTLQREARLDAEGCIGKPIGGARLRVDESTGELLVAGPMVMQQYWEDEERTAATLVNGWLHTGDLGRCDADGVWWFTGRLKDVIVRRTSKITPGEIEAALDQNSSVEMVAVVAAPDAEEGQVPVAFVVPRPGESPTPDGLRSFLSGRIAEYKVPARFHLRSSLPLTPSGKIARRELREDR